MIKEKFIFFKIKNNKFKKAFIFANKIFYKKSLHSLEVFLKYQKLAWKKKAIIFQVELSNKKNRMKNIIGIVRVIKKNLIFKNKLIKLAYLTFVCVHPKYRNIGLAKKLLNFVIKNLSVAKYDVLILSSNRSVDFFYNKFGFTGCGLYIRKKIIIYKKKNYKEISFVKNKNIKIFTSLYKKIFHQKHGRFVRNSDDWKLIFFRARIEKIKCFIIKFNKLNIGYIFFKNNLVYEICFNNRFRNKIINSLFYFVKKRKIEFLNPPKGLDNIPNTKSEDINRRLTFGGLMIKILNKKLCISKINASYFDEF